MKTETRIVYVRVPKWVHDALKDRAERTGVSINKQVVESLLKDVRPVAFVEFT